MPCAEGLHLWHKLPAPTGLLLLLLVENTTTGEKQMVTGYRDAEAKQFISALPTRHPIESEHVVVKGWATLGLFISRKRRRR